MKANSEIDRNGHIVLGVHGRGFFRKLVHSVSSQVGCQNYFHHGLDELHQDMEQGGQSEYVDYNAIVARKDLLCRFNSSVQLLSEMSFVA